MLKQREEQRVWMLWECRALVLRQRHDTWPWDRGGHGGKLGQIYLKKRTASVSLAYFSLICHH